MGKAKDKAKMTLPKPDDVAPNSKPLLKPDWNSRVHVAIGMNETRMRMMTPCVRQHTVLCGDRRLPATPEFLAREPSEHKSPTFELELWLSVYDHTCVMRGLLPGDGCYVAAGAVIGVGTYMGRGVIVNTNASVAHDCVLDNFCSVGPLANLCGKVTVGECASIGASAVVLPGRQIGAYAIVGAGSVVTKDVPPGEIWYGNPARRTSVK